MRARAVEERLSGPRHVFAKTSRGRKYWYFRSATDAAGKRHDRYVGPDSPELRQQITDHRTAKASFRERRMLVSRLRLKAAGSQVKAGKDLRQAAELLDVLVDQRPYELRDLWEEMIQRGPKWRTMARESVGLLDQATGSSDLKNRLSEVFGLTGPAH